MPWDCPDGHSGILDHVSACPECGFKKERLTMVAAKTRELVLPSRKLVKKLFLRLALVSGGGEAVAGEPYAVLLPDGSFAEGALDDMGMAKVPAPRTGTCVVCFPRRAPADFAPGAEPQPRTGTVRRLAAGEDLPRLAASLGITTHREVHEHELNAPLRELRPDADTVQVADALFLPGGAGACFACPVRPEAHRFELGPPRAYLRLRFADPEGVARPLPLGEVEVVLPGGTVRARVAPDGALLEAAERPGVPLPGDGQLRLDLRFPPDPGGARRYVRCERPGTGDATAELQLRPDLLKGPEAAEGRFFLLPGQAWGLEAAEWTVERDRGAWLPDVRGFLIDPGQGLGSAAEPVELVLRPRWQYVRFTYYDRWAGGPEQVSCLPLLVEGSIAAPGEASPAEPTTHSNWTIGDSPLHLVQCVPWITATPAEQAPELRFRTLPGTYLRTDDDEGLRREVVRLDPSDREAVVQRPGAERLRYYDLPADWCSRSWFVRRGARGDGPDGGRFVRELRGEEVLGTRTAPLVFSLDDIVLQQPDGTPARPSHAGTPAITVFRHDFASGPDDGAAAPLSRADRENRIELRRLGIHRPRLHPGPEEVAAVHWPASEPGVLGCKDDGEPHEALGAYYVISYPDWTRLIICEGNLYEVFSERTSADGAVVGARAAVAWTDVTAPSFPLADQLVEDGAFPAIERPFGTLQPLARTVAPDTLFRCASRGTPVAAQSTHPFGQATVGRQPETFDWREQGLHVGRSTLCLLRCCGIIREGGARIERAVLLQYHRLGAQFRTVELAEPDSQRGWIERCALGLARRWNGPAGPFNPGRATVEPREPGPAPLRVEVVRHFQFVPFLVEPEGPEAASAPPWMRRAETGFIVERVAAGRDWMNPARSTSGSSPGNERPGRKGSFVAAHEMGHGGGLLDDYSERWSSCSYEQPGLKMNVPGDPYDLDDTRDATSIMFGNQTVRPRHFWHLAEWLRLRLSTDLLVRHPGGSEAAYYLPHHPANAAAPIAPRSFTTFPLRTRYNGAVPTARGPRAGSFDAFLFPLGRDAYSERVLPGRCHAPGSPFDGVLVVTVHVGLDFGPDDPEHDWFRGCTASLTRVVEDTFGRRCVARFSCPAGSEAGAAVVQFARCLIRLAPRVVVANHLHGADRVRGIVEQNDLHLVVEVGHRSGLVEEPGKLPVIHLARPDVFDLLRALARLGLRVADVLRGVEPAREGLAARAEALALRLAAGGDGEATEEREEMEHERERIGTREQALRRLGSTAAQATVVVDAFRHVHDLAGQVFVDPEDTAGAPGLLALDDAARAAAAAGPDGDGVEAARATRGGPLLGPLLALLPRDPDVTRPEQVAGVIAAASDVMSEVDRFVRATRGAAAAHLRPARRLEEARQLLGRAAREAAVERDELRQRERPGAPVDRMEVEAVAELVARAAGGMATLEEQLQQHFAAYLGLDVAPGSTRGYEAFLDGVAEGQVELQLARVRR